MTAREEAGERGFPPGRLVGPHGPATDAVSCVAPRDPPGDRHDCLHGHRGRLRHHGQLAGDEEGLVEDMLALVPPLAFLIPVRRARRRSTPDHPYGFHRSTAIGHLTAAVALLAVGLLLVEDAAMGLLRAEHPPIGTIRIPGETIWSGWLMIAAMAYTGIGPFILGRMKLPVAEQLHDKVLLPTRTCRRPTG